MGNRPSRKRSDVVGLSYKTRYNSSDRSSSSQRSILRTSSTRTCFQEQVPFPTDIAIVRQGGVDVLVVADCRNKRIKTFSPGENREMSLEGVPYRMATLSQNSVAVTLPLSREIILVSVRDMKLEHVIYTEKIYNAITFLPKLKHTLVVGTLREETGSVDLINMTGSVIKSFTHDHFRNALFIDPSFLSRTPSGDILVSDYSMHALSCLTPKGDFKWRHQPHKGDNFLEDPVDVDCHDNDHIYIVDRLKKCVFRFVSNGWCFGPVIELRDKSYEPFSICIDRHRTIFMTLDDGSIQVYTDGVATAIKTIIDHPGQVT